MCKQETRMKKVLLIDDDKDVLFLLSKIIERHTDYFISTAENGLDAKSKLKDNSWDLIVTDVNLPDCKGHEIVNYARKFNSFAKILMITGDSDSRAVIEALNLKVDSYLLKPFDTSEFLSTVKNLANISKQFIAPRKILAIGAHPDDVEIGCGGTLLNHKVYGDDVSVLTLSNGEQGGNPSIRAYEARHASHLLGADLTLCDLIDTGISAGKETISVIEKVLELMKPDLIYTHSKNDAHQDHRNVYKATMVAARSVSSIECYQSPSSTIEFKPSRFVDITKQIKSKIDLIKCYETQINKCNYLKSSFIMSSAEYWGRFANYSMVEPFEVVRGV